MTAFDAAFALVVDVEGGLSMDPSDPGNWTGGACGRGALCGTKYGISAASYPGIDIATLTLDGAKGFYRIGYWAPWSMDRMPPAIATLAFDAAVNEGPGWAIPALQRAAGVIDDGKIGPVSLAAITRNPDSVLAEFAAQRALRYASLPAFPRFGLGWLRRLTRVAVAAARMTA